MPSFFSRNKFQYFIPSSTHVDLSVRTHARSITIGATRTVIHGVIFQHETLNTLTIETLSVFLIFLQIEVFSDQSDSEPNPLQAAIDLAKPGDTVMMNAGMVSNKYYRTGS